MILDCVRAGQKFEADKIKISVDISNVETQISLGEKIQLGFAIIFDALKDFTASEIQEIMPALKEFLVSYSPPPRSKSD